MIQCDREIKTRKPDIVVVNKNERTCAIIDIAIPGDIRVSKKRKAARDIRHYRERSEECGTLEALRSFQW